MMPATNFLSVEGLDGAGKTTTLSLIEAFFAKNSLPVKLTRAPGGTSLGEELRTILLDPDKAPAPLTEFLLFMADRAEHSKQIESWLEEGKHVVSDRFHDSTFAYQCCGHRISPALLSAIEHWLPLRPSLTFWVDTSLETALSRISQRDQETDRFERMDTEFHRRVQSGFSARFKNPYKGRTVIHLDGDSPSKSLREPIESALRSHFHLN